MGAGHWARESRKLYELKLGIFAVYTPKNSHILHQILHYAKLCMGSKDCVYQNMTSWSQCTRIKDDKSEWFILDCQYWISSTGSPKEGWTAIFANIFIDILRELIFLNYSNVSKWNNHEISRPTPCLSKIC